MRGLDEQIQEIKSDSLRMAAELSQLEEETAVPVRDTGLRFFVELAKSDTMRLGRRAAPDRRPTRLRTYIYSAKETPGPAQGRACKRILWSATVATGDHKLGRLLVDGKLGGRRPTSAATGQFTFPQGSEAKAGRTDSGPDPRFRQTLRITLGDW